MALVKINIPGIGEVTAENAASEDTLLRLVDAIEKQTASLAKKSGGGAGSKESKDLLDSKKKETKAADDSTKAVKASTKGADDYNKAQKKSSESLNSLKNAWEAMKPGLGQAGGALIDFGATVGKSAMAAAAAFAKTYDDVKNPIAAGQTILNTGIDMMGSAAKTAADVTTGLVKSAGGLLGPFSGAVTGAADGLNAAAKAAVDLAVTIAKTANDIFAKEFGKSVDALKSYTAQGASFAGGMTEMRTVATGANLSLKTLADSAKMSSAEFRLMGLSQGEGVKKLAKGMEAASRTIGKSGGSLRDEMLGLGYSYEEQGAVMAQYMSQQKTAGALEKMSTEQIARGTAVYAKNLKVISDITGQDAKKLMEKAQAESARGALMGKLDAEQQKAFKDAHATLMQLGPEAGPKMQAALTQMLAGGVVTDPVIAGNAQAMELIKKAAAGVKSGSQDMIKQTSKANGEFVAAQKKYGETATSTAAVLSSSFGGVGKDMATFQDSVRGLNIDPQTGEVALEAATAQAEATDKTTKGYQDITKAANAAAVAMEGLVSKNLGTYAETLSASYKTATDLFIKGVTAMEKMLNGTLFSDLAGPKTKEEAKVEEAKTKKAESTAESKKAFKDASVAQYLGIGNTKEQDAAMKKSYTAQQELYNAQLEKARAEAKAEREQGKANGEFFAKLASFFHGEGYSKGGIASGPAKGYPALLHGTEAVIPLGDGKKVPLDITGLKENLNSIDTAATMASSTGSITSQMAKMASLVTPGRPSMPGTTDLSSGVKNLDAAITSTLGEQFNKFSELFTKDKAETKQSKPTAAKSDGSEQLLKELKEIMATQLAKQDEMISKLGENVDINQRLLTNSYS